MSTYKTITADGLQEVWRTSASDDLLLIDVRSPAEYRSAKIAFAHNIPIEHLSPKELATKYGVEKPIYVTCQSGIRSARACATLADEGFPNVFAVEGGMNSCLSTKLPIEHGRKVMSIERQVRITAGSLVVAGVLLSLLHPALIFISAFVGAGLVFAGVTDTCGMGILLARMPWNK